MTTPSTDPRIIWNSQTEQARERIEQWVQAAPEEQDESLARLIAATLHGGAGTALERFAATGELDAERALEELNKVRVPIDHEAWVDALGRFILDTAGDRS